MNICIMGGTFSPIHNAHLLIAQLAKEEFAIDRLLFMPSGNPPHKRDRHIIASEHRAEMVRIAISDNPQFELCDYEIEKKSYSYTSETLEYFKNKYPNDRLYFIIGGDSLAAFETWHRPEKILSLADILVFERSGYCDDTEKSTEHLNKKYNANIHLIHAPKFDISSSMIRERLAEGKTVKYMLPDGVIDYIYKNSLYGV